MSCGSSWGIESGIKIGNTRRIEIENSSWIFSLTDSGFTDHDRLKELLIQIVAVGD